MQKVDLRTVFGQTPGVLVLIKLTEEDGELKQGERYVGPFEDVILEKGERLETCEVSTSVVTRIDEMIIGRYRRSIQFKTESGSKYLLTFATEEDMKERINAFLKRFCQGGKVMGRTSAWRRIVKWPGYGNELLE